MAWRRDNIGFKKMNGSEKFNNVGQVRKLLKFSFENFEPFIFFLNDFNFGTIMMRVVVTLAYDSVVFIFVEINKG